MCYSFLCRGMALDHEQKVALFDLTTEVNIRFTADKTQFHLVSVRKMFGVFFVQSHLLRLLNFHCCSFLQGKVFLIPADQFTMQYVEPRVHCIAVHGSFNPSRYLACA